MTDIREEMRQAVNGAAEQLARIRGCRPVDAVISIAQSFADNLRDSRGTSSEAYWQAMVTVADGIVREETGSR